MSASKRKQDRGDLELSHQGKLKKVKVFLDANILVSVIRVEYPVYIYAVRILSLQNPAFEFSTSAICIAIAYYYACKKFGKTGTKQEIEKLCNHLEILNSGAAEVMQAFNNKSIHDLEDGIEYYSAMNAGCTCIITENLNDFYYSEIEILNSQMFFDKYMTGTFLI